jgi:isoleucyl-tRNA synthetase
MDLAQRICSLTLALRKKFELRVRQPLNKIVIPILDETVKHQIDDVKKLILGPLMKEGAAVINAFTQEQIRELESKGTYKVTLSGKEVELVVADVEISSEDIPGWHLAADGKLTVALDVKITPELLEEGIARELVNRIQNMRKDKNYEVTDKISIKVKKNAAIDSAITNNIDYIRAETLAASLEMSEIIDEGDAIEVEVADNVSTSIFINKYN